MEVLGAVCDLVLAGCCVALSVAVHELSDRQDFAGVVRHVHAEALLALGERFLRLEKKVLGTDGQDEQRADEEKEEDEGEEAGKDRSLLETVKDDFLGNPFNFVVSLMAGVALGLAITSLLKVWWV